VNYEAAWDELKSWLDDQQGYIVIPVAMVKARINEAEDLWGDTE
jgi:hypothetical protein